MMRYSRSQRQRLWLILSASFALGIMIALAACAPAGGGLSQMAGSNPTGQATTSSEPGKGTLDGDVVAGPTCPVESPERPCPPQPVPDRQVIIKTLQGQTAATATTDKNGHFSVMLAPGNYLVQVAPGASQWPAQRTPVNVTIVAGKTTSIHVELDTGIR
jgi:hypothetical protein